MIFGFLKVEERKKAHLVNNMGLPGVANSHFQGLDL
jgi:hypothetical protein